MRGRRRAPSPRSHQRTFASITCAGALERLAEVITQPLPTADDLAILPPDRRLEALGTARDGLEEAEVLRRLAVHGLNEPVRPERRRQVGTFLANFTHTLALLLWFAAGLAFAAGIRELAAAIIAVVIVNGVFAFLQESRAERVVEALMRAVAVRARVRRHGVERSEVASAIVPGDIVLLAAGDVCPADIVLIESSQLEVDLSMVTGESVPVPRTEVPVTTLPVIARSGPLELPMCVPAGAAIVVGRAEGVVYATGPESTLGQVAALVESTSRGESVLERQVAGLSRLTAVLAVLAGAVTLALAAGSAGIEVVAALTFSTGVIVALVPEGLLPTLTVSLAIGAQTMAARGAAIRRLSAVEAVGAVTVICTDKTGTLTMNALTVLGFEPVDSTAAAAEAWLTAALCNDAREVNGGYEGDPLDVALARWVETQGLRPPVVRASGTCVEVEPFDPDRRYMRVRYLLDGQMRDHVKGAPEAVLELTGQGDAGITATVAAATARGERVLMLASGEPGAVRALGLVRFHDQPRAEVPAAIAACRRARIRIIMLTGDHLGTAAAVARAIGLDDGVPLMEGAEVDAMSDAQLLAHLRGDAVFARTDPRQKLRIASLLRRMGDVVVVTGDGVNDAPALRAADVGIAMGLRGTEVAKQTADIVLADDNFATIVAAIEQGRSIKANIRRFASYVFTSNVAELAPFLLFVFLNIPLPLAIMQVLAIDLGTDLLPALALGTEPPSPRTMDNPPEAPRRPLLTRELALLTFLFFGTLEAALGLGAFFGYYLAAGWEPLASLAPFDSIVAEARATTFLGIVGGQVGCLVAERDGPLWQRMSVTSNRWIGVGLAAELGLSVALVYVPGLNHLFSMAPLPTPWLLVLPASAVLFVLVDQVRRLLHRAWLQAAPDMPR